MKKILVLLTLVPFFISCQTNQSKSIVIDDLNCNLPCWKGITPGKTNMQELLALLEEMPLVDKASIANVGVPENYFNDIVRCYIIETNSVTRFYAYLIDDKVALISLDYVKGDWNITLGEILEKFGEPENVLIVNYGNDIFINFIIPSKGMVFGYNTIDKPSWWREEIAPQNTIGGIYFFDPDAFTQIMNTGELSFGILFGQEPINRMQIWKGYGNIEKLYP